MQNYKMHMLVCGGTGCKSAEADQILVQLKKSLEDCDLSKDVQVIQTGCFGFCEKGPIVKILPDNTFYTQVKPSDADEIVKNHIMYGRKVHRLLYQDQTTKEFIEDSKHMDFYKKQKRVALRNCGFINPDNIEEYIARDGYVALAECITNKTKSEVIKIVKDSGLRGRGGAGFLRPATPDPPADRQRRAGDPGHPGW